MMFSKKTLEYFGIQDWDIKDVILATFSAWLAYWVTVGVHRVYFSPLAKFPGPKLAALTFWYEFYYELWPHKFQYLWKIKALHEQYGPIIRISPYHIHINDAAVFEKIYAAGNHKRNKDPWWSHAGSKALSGSMLETMEHDLHKLRRGAVSNYFSKRSVQALEPLVKQKVEQLIARLRQDGANDLVVNLNNAMAALTMDVISAYCFGESMDSLEHEQYGKEWLHVLHQGVQMRPVGRQFPRLVNFMLDLPPEIVEKMSSTVGLMNSYHFMLLRKVKAIKKDIVEGKHDPKFGHRTVFHELLENEALPEKEKDSHRLMAESSIFLGAGTETTARTLAVTTFYLLQQKNTRDKLIAELRTVLPNKSSTTTLPQLEALPYLTACINEGLRVAHGVTSRHFRVATQEDLQYKQWTIPRGTPIAESLYLLHTDEKVWPEPFKYRPERFIENPGIRKFLVAFSAGSRSCLGMNLAYSELFFAVAHIFRQLELVVVDTIEERDVLTTNDSFIGMTDLKSEGIKIRIVGETKD